MQILGSKLLTAWVIDRSHAQPVGELQQIILDPTTLKVAYFAINSISHENCAYIRADQAVYEHQSITVQSEVCIGEKDDFLRDKPLMETPCLLTGYRVIDRSNRRIGRVVDYTVSTPHFKVERLHIGVPFWQRLLLPQRIISSKLITDVQPKKKLIIIDESTSPARSRTRQAIPVPNS